MVLACDEETASFFLTASRVLTRKSYGVALLRAFLVNLLILSASSASLCQTLGIAEVISQPPPSSTAVPDLASVILEVNRAIIVLKRGLKENWVTRNQYLSAFDKTPNESSTGQPVTAAKKYVACMIGGHLRTYQVWDEGFPIDFEVRRAIADLLELRSGAEQAKKANAQSSGPNEGAAEFHLPPCIAPVNRTAVIAAGVAAAMLETKIDPIYPAEALKNNVSGTVVLHATIDINGHVAALRIISGPAQLQQAAVNAVRQWTYRPYVLNNRPIKVETTIDVVFALNR